MAGMEKKALDQPDETRRFDHGQIDVVALPSATIGRAVFEPGWRWSQDVKPIAGTDSCQAPHTGYVISGRLATRMDDGQEMEFGPGEAFTIPPGHDGWTVGNEPCVALDFTGATDYAKPS